MRDTLQAHDEAAEEEFSYVGLASILEKPCVVKLMERGRMAAQEITIQKWFTSHPHVNIVQGICNFTCKENPIKWVSRKKRPQPFCNGSSFDADFVVIIQEYITSGDLSNVVTWTAELWRSVVLQLTYACMEWYEQGFLYGDWHFGNILLDTTHSKVHTYKALGKTFKVATHGVSPVITDFARSTLQPSGSLDIWGLTDQISMVWSIFTRSCPYDKHRVAGYSIEMGLVKDVDLVALVTRFRNDLS